MGLPPPQRDDKFYSELKQLNGDLIAYLKETHDKSPYFDFTPVLNDYIKQFSDLEKQYPEITDKPSTQTQPESQPKPQLQPLFGSSVISEPSKPFVFGTLAPLATTSSITSTTTTTAATPAPFFSFTLAKKEDNETSNSFTIGNTTNADETKGDAEEDVAPPEPNVDKYEEQGAKYSAKCKLYEKVPKANENLNFELIGIGHVYVKALDTANKVQVIVRQEPDLRRVLLNEVITPNIPVKLLPKAVQIVVPGPDKETKFFIVKLKDEKDAETLFSNMNMQS